MSCDASESPNHSDFGGNFLLLECNSGFNDIAATTEDFEGGVAVMSRTEAKFLSTPNGFLVEATTIRCHLYSDNFQNN